MSGSIDSKQQGAGDDRAQFEAWARDKYELHLNGDADYSSNFTRCAWAAWQAARQPVGDEPVAWISRIRCVGPDFGKEMYGKLPIQSLQAGFYEHIPLYAAPPAQVDLEQFRRPVKVALEAMNWAGNTDAVAECDRLLSLIDQQAGKEVA